MVAREGSGRFGAALALVLLLNCVAASAPRSATPPEIQNLRAFAKLYGYVRWFHPSDEAAAVDWQRFACLGAGRVRAARDRDALRSALDDLFLPIAPSVQIYAEGRAPAPLGLIPPDTTGFRTIAWQHRGVGLGAPNAPYRSIRLHRDAPEPAPFGTVTQQVDATPYRGKRIRLRAAARAEVQGILNRVQLWLRVDNVHGGRGFFENMDERPITRSEWASYEIVGDVAEDGASILFGGFLMGEGRGALDDFELFVEREPGTWAPIPIANPGFEQGTDGWYAASHGYEYRKETAAGRSGACLVIARGDAGGASGALFEARPVVGDRIEKPLGRGLVARVPLALYGDASRTWAGRDSVPGLAAARARLTAELGKLATLDAANPDVRLGAVIIAWNVFQHFYPYFDVVKTDWEGLLDQALAEALAADSSTFQRVLEHVVARLDDGHGRVTRLAAERRAGLPFRVHWIEGRLVVVATADSARVALGDELLAIDGVPAARASEELESRFSGTPWWKRYRAAVGLGSGERGTTAKVALSHGGERRTVDAVRDTFPGLREPSPEPIAVLRPDLYYVDLDRASYAEIQMHLERLAKAKAVIFDLRGYPRGNHDVLRHLTDQPLRSARWMVPQVIRPDREAIAGWDTSGVWTLPPRAPRIAGRIFFLTDARAISYAESVMGIVEAYRLGTIVGQATAGTNGNVNTLVLPGDYRVLWTGMRVLKHDGSQHHLVGIRPTVPVERTLRGVREGRDEVLEKALELALR